MRQEDNLQANFPVENGKNASLFRMRSGSDVQRSAMNSFGLAKALSAIHVLASCFYIGGMGILINTSVDSMSGPQNMNTA